MIWKALILLMSPLISGNLVAGQVIESNIEFTAKFNEQKKTHTFELKNKTSQDCGFVIVFGDGEAKEVVVSRRDSEIVTYNFKRNGIFPVFVFSGEVRTLWSRGGKCLFEETLRGDSASNGTWRRQGYRSDVTWINTSDHNNLSELDVLYYANPDYFKKNIDGSLGFQATGSRPVCADASLLSERPIQPASWPMEVNPLFHLNALYKSVGVEHASEVAIKYLHGKMQNPPKSMEAFRCSGNRGDEVRAFSLMAIPRGFLDTAQRTFPDLKRWTIFSELAYSNLRSDSLKIVASENEYANWLLKNREQYLDAAKRPEKLHTGSLLIGWSKIGREARVCRVSYASRLDTAAVLGHEALGEQMLLPHLREKYKEKGMSFSPRTTFDSLNEAFLTLVRDPAACGVLVAFPHDIVKLDEAFKRDAVEFDREFGPLSTKLESLERSARLAGFGSHAEREFALSVGISVAQLSQLKQLNVSTLNEYEAAQKEISNSGYSTDDSSFGAILQFLEDRRGAAARGVSAVEEKKSRLAREEAARQKSAENRRKAQLEYEKEYPFEALLTCKHGSSSFPLQACMMSSRGSLQTELELTNGKEYGMFKAHDLRRVGRDLGNGFLIPLRRKFSLTAQNASEDFILSVKIRETGTDTVRYERAVSKFGVIKVAQ